jgi:hypothetical protein
MSETITVRLTYCPHTIGRQMHEVGSMTPMFSSYRLPNGHVGYRMTNGPREVYVTVNEQRKDTP